MIRGTAGFLNMSPFSKDDTVVLFISNLSGSDTFALSRFIPEDIDLTITLKVFFSNEDTSFRRKLALRRETGSSKVVVGCSEDMKFKRFGNIYIAVGSTPTLQSNFLLDKSRGDSGGRNSKGAKKRADYYLSYSPFYTVILNAILGLNVKRYIVTGMPRNDFLFFSNAERNFASYFNKEPDGRVIFYLPAPRVNKVLKRTMGKFYGNIINIPDFDIDAFVKFLERNDLYFVVKFDPSEVAMLGPAQKAVLEENERILMIDDERLFEIRMDLYELLPSANLLITDYSTVYFDYLLLDRPMIFVPADIRYYRQEKGFILEPYEKWVPGPIITTQKELQKEILNMLRRDGYRRERQRLREILHTYTDASSSRRVWRFIAEVMRRS